MYPLSQPNAKGRFLGEVEPPNARANVAKLARVCGAAAGRDSRPMQQELTAAQARGRREHKDVSRLTFEAAEPPAEKRILPGPGTALSSIESINEKLVKASADQIEDLHRLLYGRPGSRNVRLRDVKRFSGFPDAEPNLQPKLALLGRLTLKRRKELLAIMCLPQSDPDRDIGVPYGAKPLLTFLRGPSAVGCASASKRKRVDTVAKEVKPTATEVRQRCLLCSAMCIPGTIGGCSAPRRHSISGTYSSRECRVSCDAWEWSDKCDNCDEDIAYLAEDDGWNPRLGWCDCRNHCFDVHEAKQMTKESEDEESEESDDGW